MCFIISVVTLILRLPCFWPIGVPLGSCVSDDSFSGPCDKMPQARRAQILLQTFLLKHWLLLVGNFDSSELSKFDY